jgi:hypothetical protein
MIGTESLMDRRSAWEWSRAEGGRGRKDEGEEEEEEAKRRERKIEPRVGKKLKKREEKTYLAVFVLERDDPVAVQVERGAEADDLVGLGAAAGCVVVCVGGGGVKKKEAGQGGRESEGEGRREG